VVAAEPAAAAASLQRESEPHELPSGRPAADDKEAPVASDGAAPAAAAAGVGVGPRRSLHLRYSGAGAEAVELAHVTFRLPAGGSAAGKQEAVQR
jgi:hypothetical protein